MKRKHWLKNDKEKIEAEAEATGWVSKKNALASAENSIMELYNNQEIPTREKDIAIGIIQELRKVIEHAEANGDRTEPEEFKRKMINLIFQLSRLRRGQSETQSIDDSTGQTGEF